MYQLRAENATSTCYILKSLYLYEFEHDETMLPQLNNIHRILYIDLKPQLSRDKPETWWLGQRLKIKPQKIVFPIKAQLVFLNDPHPMLVFYRQLIDNDLANFYNNANTLIDGMDKPPEKSYLAQSIINKTLHDKLKELNEIIRRKKYHWECLFPGKGYEEVEPSLVLETYIFHYIKLGLVVLYQNIQDRFSEFIEKPLSIDDIFRIYFREEIPTFSFSQDAPEYIPPIKPKVIEKTFAPRNYEVDAHLKLRMTAENIRDKASLKLVEQKMIEYGLLNDEYKFIPNKGNAHTTLMAAIYKRLIQKNYFRLNVLGSKRKLKELDIRKYLDELYQADTSQQFRRMDENTMNNAFLKLPWLEKI